MLVKSHQAEQIYDISGIQVQKRSIGFKQYGLFIMWLEVKTAQIKLASIEQKLIQLCKKEKALFVQIETLSYNEETTLPTKVFTKWYYKNFIFTYSVIVDLEQDEEEIRNWMKPKWRYNIKQAVKKWVIIEEVEWKDENLEKFYDLVQTTTTRDKFQWNSMEYYKTFLETIPNSSLLFAYHEGKVIAWGIFIFHEERAYYYYWVSSSDREERKLMAPYLLQWRAIQMWKEKWCILYDFFGIAPEWEENHSLKWVTDFKKKFSNRPLKVSEQYLFVENNIMYHIMILLRYINKLKKSYTK